MDNPFDTPTTGQADWDSGLGANFQAIERGYHVTERVGQDVSSGQILTLTSSGFFVPYSPASASIAPHAYAYTSALSGETFTALAWGIVRSLDINSPAVAGQLMFSSASGFLSVATLGLPVGIGLTSKGVLFKPALTAGGGGGGGGYSPTYFSNSLAINAVVGSLHTFTFSLGTLLGWNRRVRMNAASASNVELKLYANSARTNLQYSTASGGVSAVGSFNDRAAFPFDCDSGTIYGTLSVFSVDISSDTINVQAFWNF